MTDHTTPHTLTGRIRRPVVAAIVASLSLIAGLISAQAQIADEVANSMPGIGSVPKQDFGHYFNSRPGDDAEDAARLCNTSENVEGVVSRKAWIEVETAVRDYDFGDFDDVLETIPSDCKLFLFVEWKSFPSSTILNPCPADLQEDYSALNANGGGVGYTCFMWKQEVVNRFNDMQTALAERYDGNPQVEGLILQETALGFDPPEFPADGTYGAMAYSDALESIYRTCSREFSSSWCVPFMNFLQDNQTRIRILSNRLEELPNVCLGGPDILPSRKSLYQSEDRIYEVLLDYDGCRANSAQNDSYNERSELPPVGGSNNICVGPDPENVEYPCTMNDIWRFGVRGTIGDFNEDDPYDSGLCINGFFFWNHKAVKTLPNNFDYTDAVGVIDAHPYGPGWTDRCDDEEAPSATGFAPRPSMG